MHEAQKRREEVVREINLKKRKWEWKQEGSWKKFLGERKETILKVDGVMQKGRKTERGGRKKPVEGGGRIRKTGRRAGKVKETGGEASSSRLTTKSVINNNKNLASLYLLQIVGCGLRQSITLMYHSALACRVGARGAELHLLLHFDHSAALQPD